MRLAMDAMGGDNAPKAVVEGAVMAVSQINNLHITLVGDKEKIRPFLTDETNIDILHTTEVITGDDEPVRSVRRKKSSSMVFMAKEVKEQRVDACISGGNTGALVSAGLFVVGRNPCIARPALSPTLSTVNVDSVLFLDVGANVSARSNHLLQYAIMGSIYAAKVRMIK